LRSAFSFISTRGEEASAQPSGNSLIRLPLSRDGQGKNIGEKIERSTQFGCAIVRIEFGNEVVRHKNKIRRGEKIQEGVRPEIAIQWLAEKWHRSNI
jgi:hypothetical protein